MSNAGVPPLPPRIPARFRVSLFLVKFLEYHNRLNGAMAFLCVWWGAWTLVFPDFWGEWPATVGLGIRTLGHPQILSWTLFVSGWLNYLGQRFRWATVRSVASLASFAAWCTLTQVFLTVSPIASPAVAVYSAAAIAELMAYVNFKIGIDQRT